MTANFRIRTIPRHSDAVALTIREGIAAAALIAMLIQPTLTFDDDRRGPVDVAVGAPPAAAVEPPARSWKDAYQAPPQSDWAPKPLPPVQRLAASPASVFADPEGAAEAPRDEPATTVGDDHPESIPLPPVPKPTSGAAPPEATTAVNPAPAAAPAPTRTARPMLTVTSLPSGARVELGGETVGVTPLVIGAPTGGGDLAISVSAVNHRPWTGVARPAASGHYTLSLILTPR